MSNAFAAGAWVIVLFIGTVLLLLLVWMIREAKSFRVTEEEVVLDRLPQAFDGLRLFFISDLHRRMLKETHMQQIKRHDPAQLYLIGGDVTEKGADLQQALASIRAIRQLGTTYLVHGNHDFKADVRQLDTAVMEMGVKVLDNESVRLEQDGEVIWLVGIDDIRTGRANMEWAMEEPERDPHLTLMVTHDPIILKKPLSPLIDLVIAGHTHGGQINIPGYGPVRTSDFYRKHLRGWHSLSYRDANGLNRLKLFVSNGFGTSHLPLRLGARPEAHYITLRSKQTVS